MNVSKWLTQLRSITTSAFTYILGWDDTRKEWRRMTWATLVSLLSSELGGGGPADTDTLASDYTVTSAGEKVLEVTAPAAGLYRVDIAAGGVFYGGALGTFDGNFAAKAMVDWVGEGDQTNYQTNFKTIAGVTGIVAYETDHSTAPYATGTDLFFRSATHQHNYYAGTANGGYQSLLVYLEAGGKVAFYCKDDNTNAGATGGYHKLLAGTKLTLTSLASFTYPPVVVP